MENEVIIGIGSLVLAVLIYFAGIYRTKIQLSKKEKQERINNVFNQYMEFRKSNLTGGYDGLLKAGVTTLRNDNEIRELYNQIVQHGEKPPLEINKFKKVNLKNFFDYVIKNKINFQKTSIEDIFIKLDKF